MTEGKREGARGRGSERERERGENNK